MHHLPQLQLSRTAALSNQRRLAFYLAAKDSKNLYMDISLKLKTTTNLYGQSLKSHLPKHHYESRDYVGTAAV